MSLETTCPACTTAELCTENGKCRLDEEAAALERRKLLAAKLDRGIVGAFQEFGTWCAMNDIDVDKVIIGIACKDEETRSKIEMRMETDRRIDDLTLRPKTTTDAINTHGTFKLMGVKGMIVLAPKEYRWPTN